jgi:hypothetical protein
VDGVTEPALGGNEASRGVNIGRVLLRFEGFGRSISVYEGIAVGLGGGRP